MVALPAMLELKKEVPPLLLLVMVAWSAVLVSPNCVCPPILLMLAEPAVPLAPKRPLKTVLPLTLLVMVAEPAVPKRKAFARRFRW
jgi:hypothetical protein